MDVEWYSYVGDGGGRLGRGEAADGGGDRGRAAPRLAAG